MDNIELKRKLTLEELGILETEMLKKGKTKEAAWGLWAGLHFFGAHRFYTEDRAYATAMLVTSSLSIIGIVTLLCVTDRIEGISALLMFLLIFIFAGTVIWSWVDSVFINRRIEQLNNRIELETIEKIKKKRLDADIT